jgi:hypothetical protein
MPEYIEREWLLAEADKVFKSYKPSKIPKGEAAWIAKKFLVEKAPSVAVAPVKVGSWEFNDKYATVCSVCKTSPYKGLDADIWSAWEPSYCPNCGAKMKETENKE